MLARTLQADALDQSGHVRWDDGTCVDLDVARWLAEPSDDELDLIAGATAPVLDVGCGPGRRVAALTRKGVDAAGIDVLPDAVRIGRRRGATVLKRSVFEPVPRAGEWATILLLDGNIGIGGDPIALLRRVRGLLRPGGRALVELEAPGIPLHTATARIESPAGHSTEFPWGRIGIDHLHSLTSATGFECAAMRSTGDRWFAWLRAT